MSETHRLLNASSGPVQLHLRGDVLVVPPLGEAQLTADELEDGQIRELRRQGVLTALAQPEPPKTTPRKRRRRSDGL